MDETRKEVKAYMNRGFGPPGSDEGEVVISIFKIARTPPAMVDAPGAQKNPDEIFDPARALAALEEEYRDSTAESASRIQKQAAEIAVLKSKIADLDTELKASKDGRTTADSELTKTRKTDEDKLEILKTEHDKEILAKNTLYGDLVEAKKEVEAAALKQCEDLKAASDEAARTKKTQAD